jgi:hypothetical protein
MISMAIPKRSRSQSAVAVKRVHDVSRHRKLGRFSDQIESFGLEMRPHDPLREVAGAAILQHVLQS